jgi:hypothetical protein
MAEEKESGGTEWMQKLWRPAMGWMYMLICLLDMAVFPVCWSLLQAMMHMPITQWNPLTLQGAGLFHIAMGAVLGISAFGRTQEKLAGTAANPTATSQIVTNNQNMSGNVAGGFGSNSTPSFGGAGNGGFNSSPSGAPAFGAAPAGFGAPAGGFGASATATGGFGAPAPVTNSFGSQPLASGSGFGSTPTAPTSGFGSSSGFGAPAASATVTTGFGGKKVVPDFPQPAI